MEEKVSKCDTFFFSLLSMWRKTNGRNRLILRDLDGSYHDVCEKKKVSKFDFFQLPQNADNTRLHIPNQ
jgi:hypothetical protein